MGFRETIRLDAMADAARDWHQARLADSGRAARTVTDEDYDYEDMADQARDWWYGLTDAERAEVEAEYFENYSGDVTSCWSYLDIFRTGIEAMLDKPAAVVFHAGITDLLRKPAAGDRRCKLSRRQVDVIRLAYADGDVGLRLLARSFGVSPSTMWKILHRHSWKDQKQRTE